MSVVTDKLCPKLDNLHINNQTEDKENRVQFNGILNGRVVRYFVKMFPPFFCTFISGETRRVSVDLLPGFALYYQHSQYFIDKCSLCFMYLFLLKV